MGSVYMHIAKRVTAIGAVITISAAIACLNPLAASGGSINDNAYNGLTVSNALAIDVTAADMQIGEYASKLFAEKNFAAVSLKAIITNIGMETVQIVGASTPPQCFSVISGSTVVKNAIHEDGKPASTDNLFSPQGLNLGRYAPGESAVITFGLIIDDSKLVGGLNNIPIYVSARATDATRDEGLEWVSDFVTDSATISVKKHKDGLFSWEDFPKLAAVAVVGALAGAAFTALFDGLYGERLRLRAKEKIYGRKPS